MTTKAAFNEKNGSHYLKKGTTYYLDDDEDKLLDSKEIISFISLLGGKSSIGEILHSGRGQVMISFTPSSDVVIPNSILRKTGFLYELEEASLADQQRALYGETYDEPMGFFDYIEDVKPKVFDSIDNALASIKDAAKKTGKYIAWGVGGTLAAVFLLAILRRVR